MQILDGHNNLILDVEVDDTSYRYRTIMGDHSLTLKFALAEHVEIPVGAWTEYQSEVYTLMRPEALTMKHSANFEYTVTMDSAQAWAKIWKFRNMVDGRLKFSLTAQPQEHLQMFIDNMNAREGSDEWAIGTCIEGVEVCINYDHAYCYDALGQMADVFETEFEIAGKTVSLKKLEYNKDNPLPLSYGRGNGFQPSIARSNDGDTPPVEILYPQGGEDNIDASQYGNSVLLLPTAGTTIGYDGEHFSDDEGWSDEGDDNRWYVVDADRLSIRRYDKALESKAEDSLDCSSIYPKHVGTISAVVHDKTNDFWDIIDDSNSIDYSACLIAGETMTIIFQSGQLAGKEFEVQFIAADNRFEIVPQEIDGYTMPCSAGGYYPQEGDSYAVFHIMLPQEYIAQAEQEMLRTAVQYFYEHEEQLFTFSAKLDGIWAKDDWENIGGRILLGGYISFSDPQFQALPLLVRITGIKDYINNPHAPEIELSNGIISAGFSTSLRQIESQSIATDDRYRDAITFTKRRWRDTQETLTMLQAAVDNFSTAFTNSITPITVQTMALLVGDESLQFRYIEGTGSTPTSPYTATTHAFNYSNKQLSTAEGIIQHMTLDIDTISDSHTDSEYRTFYLPAYASGILDDGSKAYYLYAHIPYISTRGNNYVLSETPLDFYIDGISGGYNLLVGILNSEYDGDRSFVTLYGYTEVLPGRITTDMVVSHDGNTYIDLVNSVISGKIVFKNGGEDVTTIDGGVVTSGTLQVGESDGDGNVAGLTADGSSSTETSPVRFWAGADYSHRASAPFRVTQDGSISATKGQIAGFTITDEETYGSSLVATAARIRFFSDEALGNGSYLSSGLLYFNNEYITCSIGLNASNGITPYIQQVANIEIDASKSGFSMIQRSVGIEISVNGCTVDVDNAAAYGNHALYIGKGDICGFRLRTRRISKDTTLTVYDSNILVTADGITITLPSSTEDGQMYFIRRIPSIGYTIAASRDHLIYTGNNSGSGENIGRSSIPVSSSDLFILIFDNVNSCWWCNYASCDLPS